jgi:protein TonB
MRDALEDYRGIYVPTPREGRLMGAQAFQFTKYVPPKYPPMARMALVEGNVSLLVTASPQDGSVQQVKVLSGHKMLQDSAIEAVRQWIFRPGQEKLNAPIAVTVEFSFRCPKL